jgi:chromosomal replication initiation ATPase DnaA
MATLDEPLCRLIGDIVATASGVAVSELRAPGRGPASTAFARQTAIYLGHVVFGLSLTRLGHAFGRDRTTARHACRTVEERRDDPATDRRLSILEAACGDAAAALAPKCGRTEGQA